MRYSEKTLQSWTAPLLTTEERRAENAIKMIIALPKIMRNTRPLQTTPRSPAG